MKNAAVFDGHRFTFIEALASLDSNDETVICQGENGARFACPRKVWEEHVEIAASLFTEASITNKSSTDDKIALFRSLFSGRCDVYAKRWFNVKTGQSGYMPACKNEWVSGVCNRKTISCGRCPNRDLLPLTDDVIYRHLEGKDEYARDVVGLYPMLPDETTHFLAIDFDDEGWREDVAAFIATCEKYGLQPAVERSRSGNGGHVWFFFGEPIPASKARKLGSGLISNAMDHRANIKMKSYDRLFPNQDTLPNGGFGNLIALPLQGKARRIDNSVFLDGQFEPWPDQWAFLSCIPKISPERLELLVHDVCRGGELGMLTDANEDDAPWERPKPIKSSDRIFQMQSRLYWQMAYMSRRMVSPKRLATGSNDWRHSETRNSIKPKR